MFRVTFPGPFSGRDVVVDGWLVPFLEAIPSEDESQITLLLDRRIGLTIPVGDSDRIIPFLADVIAFALGFAAHPGADDDRPSREMHPRLTRVHLVDDALGEAA